MATYRDPFERLQAELEQMVQQAFAAFGPGGVYPPVNVFDAGDAFVIKAELPGLDPKAIELSVEDGALTLRGERKLPEPQAGAGDARSVAGGVPRRRPDGSAGEGAREPAAARRDPGGIRR